MNIEFRERPTQEHNFQLEVRKAGALIGHLRRSADGFFQYYRGPLNLLMYEFEDDDLERLKQRIASREAPATLTSWAGHLTRLQKQVREDFCSIYR